MEVDPNCFPDNIAESTISGKVIPDPGTCQVPVEYANDSLNHSVTSGPCLWKKKERRSTDNPVPVNELSTSSPGSSRSEPSTTEYYDPCPGLLPDVNAFYEGLKVLQPNVSRLLNRYKVVHTAPVKEVYTITPNVKSVLGVRVIILCG